jgi:hypothetical protein
MYTYRKRSLDASRQLHHAVTASIPRSEGPTRQVTEISSPLSDVVDCDAGATAGEVISHRPERIRYSLVELEKGRNANLFTG